jgi:hypothetical protein
MVEQDVRMPTPMVLIEALKARFKQLSNRDPALVEKALRGLDRALESRRASGQAAQGCAGSELMRRSRVVAFEDEVATPRHLVQAQETGRGQPAVGA